MSSKRSRATYEASHAPYALYGTPLPAFDPDARDDGSYVPLWKQEVTDERGRKRLHGAFTGGFSAGYFNTVGSKEGWAPSTFVSSRTNRAAKGKDGGQKVEDFMDEEDLAERAERETLETQDSFAGLGATKGDGQGRGMFSDMFKSDGETMGVKLLQRMGWRPGQGVGPKVRRRAKGDKSGEEHLFAPDDSKMIGFQRKTDRKGMGFAREERLSHSAAGNGEDEDEGGDEDARILQTKHSKLLTKPKKLKKSGFGIGVLNDTGSDDENDYDMGPKISYNRIIGGDRKKKSGLTASNATVRKPVIASLKKAGQRTSTMDGFRKCHDGRLPLDGFILSMASMTITQENKYPPLAVPEGWKSTKSSETTDADPKSTYQSTADAAKASTLDPASRADLLGEQRLPGKSIFDFIKPSTRDRLAAATGKTNLPAALSEGAPAGFEPSEAEKRRTLWDLVPDLEKETAEAALQRGSSGWMPYAEDERKRERYRAFLQLRAGLHSTLPERAAGMGSDEWAREMSEFAQAAKVFRPVSGLMGARFTSSASSAPRLASDAPDSAPQPSKSDEDPAMKAAKMGLYGPLTRERRPFYPTRLLCKRFNVKAPATVDPGDATGDSVVPESRRLDVVSMASLEGMMRDAGKGFVKGGMEGGTEPGGLSESKRREEKKVDVETNDALEGKKAGDAVFKAIFGDDEDDDG